MSHPGDVSETPKMADGEPKRVQTQAQRDALKQHAIKPGEVRNKSGANGWKKAQSRIARFLREADPDDPRRSSRWDNLLLAAYETALIRGLKGSADRKLLIEQVAGKARAQLDLNASVSGLRVLAVLPDNGRGPGDPEDPDDGTGGAAPAAAPAVDTDASDGTIE